MKNNKVRKTIKTIVVVVYLLFAISFVLSCYGGIFFSSVLWPLGFFPLAALYLFTALLLFFIFWIFAKSKWSLVFILVLLICWPSLKNIIPFNGQSVFSQSKKNDALRVMSWNVAQFDILESKTNPGTKNKMVELIRQYQPDVACFQEMVAGDSAVNLNTPYYKKYSFFSVNDFTQRLQFRDHFFSYHVGQDFLSYQHFGLIIFSRYPIVNRQKISFLSKGYNNFFQFADIVKNNDTIRVFNIHLQSLKFNRTNRDYIDNPTFDNSDDVEQSKNVIAKFKWAFNKRKIQTDYIFRAIKQSPYPVIVCGDFNDVPNSYAYQKIGEGLQNCFVEKGFGIGRTFSAISPTLRIDNIFVAPSFVTDQFSRINKLLSDHFPIIADVLLHKE